MPSWYNLFFATAGIGAFYRYLESPRWGRSLLAGISGGLSCVFKIVGIYFVAAGFLFLLFLEQSRPRPELKDCAGGPGFYCLFVSACGIFFVVALIGLSDPD